MHSYTTCGQPVLNDDACQKCNSCRDGRVRLRRIAKAGQFVIAAWEHEASKLEPALEELRSALDDGVILNSAQ